MNKPLKDWTLGEIKAECKKHGNKHTGCVFWADGGAVGYCRLEDALDKTYPQAWDLAEPPRWTEQEIERAKAIKVLFTKASFLRRSEITLGLYGYDGNWIIDLNSRLFPSLHVNEKVTFDEIIGGGE